MTEYLEPLYEKVEKVERNCDDCTIFYKSYNGKYCFECWKKNIAYSNYDRFKKYHINLTNISVDFLDTAYISDGD